MTTKNRRTAALFGSGGNPQNFYDDIKIKDKNRDYKDTSDIFRWLGEKNIDSYEYQAGSGLNAGITALKKIGEEAAKNNIVLSLHAPYFISIASDDAEIIAKSINHIIKCVVGASVMGADIIVVHSGALGKNTREKALEKAKFTMSSVLESLYKSNKTNVKIGLETMGKQNQLGTLEEVIELCKIDAAAAYTAYTADTIDITDTTDTAGGGVPGKILYPVVDFGHLNARETGKMFKTSEDYQKVFDNIGENLSDEIAKYLHCHFSKIEYTQKGEKKHLTFSDKTFGPEFEPLAEVLAKNKLYPNIICESDGTMDTDALFMKKIYEDNLNNL